MAAPSAPPPAADASSVLFVCLGNICRSPMAEGIFRSLAANSRLISSIDSCGTGAYHTGDPPDSRSLSVLETHGITDYTHCARKFTSPDDFKRFEYIFAMDGANLDDLLALKKRAIKRGELQEAECGKVMLFGAFRGKGALGSAKEEICDPYYGGRDGFTIAYGQATEFSKNFLQYLEQQAG